MQGQRKQGLLAGVLLLLLFGLLVASCAGPAPASTPVSTSQPGQVYKIKFSTGVAETHLLAANVIKPWIETVNREGKGRIEATLYAGGVLGKQEAVYDAVAKGAVEAGQSLTSYTPANFPLTEVMSTPLACPNPIIGASLLNGPLFNKYFSQEFKNVKLLGMAMTGAYQIFTRKPVRTLEDLKGLKIRVAGGMHVNIMKAFGAVPVSLSTAEMYEGLQKGTIDGTFFIISTIETYNLWEVCKYVTETNLAGNQIILVMNKDFWDSLPRDLQLAVEFANKDIPMNIAYKQYWNEDARVRQRMVKEGMEIVTVSPSELKRFQDAAQKASETWIEEKEKAGFPARQVYNDLMAQPELYGLR